MRCATRHLARPSGWAGLLLLCLAGGALKGQQPPVTLQVAIASRAKEKEPAVKGDADIVAWLKPLDPVQKDDPPRKRQTLLQVHKTFEPHVLAVQVGSVVDFPNHDPFFHNVFSLFEGKRFDLGLYEAGATNSVRFDRVGVSYLFCNIHPEMSAVVVSVDTPYYGISDRTGKISIPNVPDGRYEIHYWSERGLPEGLKQLTRTVTISGSNRNLAPVEIAENPNFTTLHKNKYGQDYVPPPSTDYSHPQP